MAVLGPATSALSENPDKRMPTLLNKDGFKFFFYANEHEPRHMHVIKGEGFLALVIVSAAACLR